MVNNGIFLILLQTQIVGTDRNRLDDMVLLSTNYLRLRAKWRKILYAKVNFAYPSIKIKVSRSTDTVLNGKRKVK